MTIVARITRYRLSLIDIFVLLIRSQLPCSIIVQLRFDCLCSWYLLLIQPYNWNNISTYIRTNLVMLMCNSADRCVLQKYTKKQYLLTQLIWFDNSLTTTIRIGTHALRVCLWYDLDWINWLGATNTIESIAYHFIKPAWSNCAQFF